MFHFVSRGRQHFQARFPQISVEVLENRRLMSASLVPADTTEPPVAALDLNATAGKALKGEVGTWTVAGVPSKASGVVAIAVVSWGDGKTSRAKFVDDGSGVVQIIASHAWAKPGTFQTTVKVEEYPKGHAHNLTDIGQGGASAVVAPKPHKVSVKGTFTGSYTTPLGNPDARNYVFTGTGTAGALGAADLSGSITPPGFIRTAPATGELTLTNASGSVTLECTGKTQSGGSPLPQKMTYIVTNGTGAYANAGGKGSIAIALNTDANTFVFVIH
ncbi:MAG: hypothetical protein JWN24_711 [Phycisphaerales bacterium]|nr:hypothetical protein [Phycisphaerales bacterium]